MALQFLSRAIWNSYIHTFITQYCDNFPELTHANTVLKDTLTKLLEKNLKMQMREVSASDDEKSDPETDEDDRQELVIISQMFIDSFRPFADRLKACDEGLLAESKCVFLQHLQINRKWWNGALDDADKDEIWKFLNGAYLILEIFVCTPPAIMRKLETMVGELFDKVVRKKKEFVKSEFTAAAKTILHDIKTDDIHNMTEYFWEFITSKFTPIYALVPESYHTKIVWLLKAVQLKSGREYLMSHISPLVEDVKKRVGKTSLGLDEKEGKIIYDDDLKGDGEDTKEKIKKEKERILECIIDAIADVLAKNKGLLKKIVDNPAEGMSLLMGALVPVMAGFVDIAKSDHGSEEETKRAQDEKEEKYLKGAPVLARKSQSKDVKDIK
jgi:hypothetical protein